MATPFGDRAKRAPRVTARSNVFIPALESQRRSALSTIHSTCGYLCACGCVYSCFLLEGRIDFYQKSLARSCQPCPVRYITYTRKSLYSASVIKLKLKRTVYEDTSINGVNMGLFSCLILLLKRISYLYGKYLIRIVPI